MCELCPVLREDPWLSKVVPLTVPSGLHHNYYCQARGNAP